MTHACHPRSVDSGLEFRPGNGDDSWYFVSLRLQYGKLIVRHEGCSDKRGKEWEVADVKNGKELYDKFRPPSRRLEDENCQEVNPGCKVCVSCYPDEQESPESIRYFDAEIEKIGLELELLPRRVNAISNSKWKNCEIVSCSPSPGDSLAENQEHEYR